MRVLIINDTRGDYQGHFGCHLVMKNLTDVLKQQSVTDIFFSPVGEEWSNLYKRLIKYNKKFDIIIVNGEGTLHNSECYKRSKNIMKIVEECAKIYDAPIFLINATLYNNSQEFYKKFHYFKKVFVRDKLSSDELTRENIPHKLAPDLTFDTVTYTKNRQNIACTDSVYGHINDEIIEFCAKHNLEYCSMLSPESFQLRDLQNICALRKKTKLHKALFKNKISFPKTAKLVSFGSYHEFLEWVSSKEMIITGRYHCVTMCIKTKTPFMAIASNTPKIQTLLEMVFGNSNRMIQSVADIDIKMEQYSRYSSEELEKIDIFLKNTKDAQEDMFKSITICHAE